MTQPSPAWLAVVVRPRPGPLRLPARSGPKQVRSESPAAIPGSQRSLCALGTELGRLALMASDPCTPDQKVRSPEIARLQFQRGQGP